MRILHILRARGDERGLAMARAQANAHDVTILLLHDAVLDEVVFPGQVYASRDDLEARGGPPQRSVDYDEVIALICAHDRVISW